MDVTRGVVAGLAAAFLVGLSGQAGTTLSASIAPAQPNLLLNLSITGGLDGLQQASPGDLKRVNVTVKNWTGDPMEAFRIGIYLSTDAVCATDDTLIASHDIDGLRLQPRTITAWAWIPPETPLGSRFVCAYADDLLEVPEENEGDNTRVRPIDIVPATLSLKVNGLDPTPPVVATDGPMALTLTMAATTSTADVSLFWALIYDGALVWITPSGVSVTAAPFYTGPPFVVTDLPMLNLTLPAGASIWNALYLGDSTGSIIAFDHITAAVSTTVTAPNIIGGNPIPNPGPYVSGQAHLFLAPVLNAGTGATGPFRIGTYLSADAECTTADTLVGSISADLPGGTASGILLLVRFPPYMPTGDHFLCAIADDQMTVAESDESDNTRTLAVTITAAPLPNLASRW